MNIQRVLLAAVVGCLALGLGIWGQASGGDATTQPSAKKGAETKTESSSDSGVASNEGFALVELYTSEGCSSCPSADRVLSDLEEEAHKKGTRVFPIAIQVDYWNNLGWVDPYSSERFSARQRLYAERLELASIYTPQMIVNGGKEFVGSDRATADDAIKGAMGRKATTGVGVEARWVKGTDGTKRVVVEYKLSDVPTGTPAPVVEIVVVERGLVSHVGRGENSGRTLVHDNVVRVWEERALDAGMKVELKTPADMKEQNTSVVVFVQDPRTMKVLGAGTLRDSR